MKKPALVQTILRESSAQATYSLKSDFITGAPLTDQKDELKNVYSFSENVVTLNDVNKIIYENAIDELNRSMPPVTDSFSKRLHENAIFHRSQIQVAFLNFEASNRKTESFNEFRMKLENHLADLEERGKLQMSNSTERIDLENAFRGLQESRLRLRQSATHVRDRDTSLEKVEKLGRVRHYSSANVRRPTRTLNITASDVVKIRSILHRRLGEKSDKSSPLLTHRSRSKLDLLNAFLATTVSTVST